MANVFRTVIRIITCIALFICPMPTEKKCEAEFNGTFIQSWMSSYWDDERWQDEIGAMKEAGIKYLIIQDVAHKASDGHMDCLLQLESRHIHQCDFRRCGCC